VRPERFPEICPLPDDADYSERPINFLMAVHKDILWSTGAKALRRAANVIDNKKSNP
jgi:hypothetical protein